VNYPFNAQSGLVVVQTEIFGPSGSIVLSFALDTGATGTMINVAPLTAIGYDSSLASERVQVTTGSGVEYAPRISVARFKSMEQERFDFPALAHTLPPSASIDGLLGLDFLRGQKLELDFQQGIISLST